jgi:signal transduction histidine kinase
MKWGRSQVRLTISTARVAGAGTVFDLVVEDDGTGIPEEKLGDVVRRGARLDETKPGTGLGLSIVADLAKEYGGGLALGRSDLGGLKATITLSAAE